MHTKLYSRLVMLGAGPETRGSTASTVEAYRTHGLFKRWPVDYVVTRRSAGALQSAAEYLKALARFCVLLASERQVALHVHSAAQAGFWRNCMFMALAAAARRPIILQLHGGGFDRFYDGSSSTARAAIRFVLEQAARVIVPCESLRVWIRSISRNTEVSCIPGPVVLPELMREASRSNLILFLGPLEEEKGIFDLLEAVAVLRASISDLRLVCAGAGDPRAVARYAERLGIRETVKFTGWVGPSGKRTLLESAAVFVLPSYGAGLPLSLLEAMAAGVAVIASPVGGIPEVVVDGVSGLLVAPGDTATLARQMRKLLVDREFAARLGAAARESVRLRFAPESAIAQIEEVYSSIGVCACGERRSAAPTMPMREAA